MLKGACIPLRVHTVVISIQHSDDVTVETIRRDLMEKVVKVVIPSKYLDDQTIYHLNPSGKFVIGGPQVRLLFNYTNFYYISCTYMVLGQISVYVALVLVSAYHMKLQLSH